MGLVSYAKTDPFAHSKEGVMDGVDGAWIGASVVWSRE
jgi:hypothetical protein